MSIPRIRKDFKKIMLTTPKAIQFLDFDGKTHWVPRSICTLIKEKKDRVVATLAVFKFEEITNIKVEPLTTTFNSLGGEVLPPHKTDCKIHHNKMYEYKQGQLRCIEKAIKSKYTAFFCEAGTGKTLMSLTVAYSRLKEGLVNNVIVMCPASLQTQWLELSKLYFNDMDISVHSIHGASYESSLERIKKEFYNKIGKVQLIVDESHLCKNQSAKRSRNMEKTFRADYTMILTGFPIERNAGDLFYQFGIMDRSILGCKNYGQFQSKFLLLGGKDGERVVAYQNTKELAERISPYIARLTKKEVEPTLPEKHYHEVYFDMNENQMKAYNAINALMSSYSYLPETKQYQLSTFAQKLSSGYTPTDLEINSIFNNLGKLGDGAENVSKISTIAFDANNNRMIALKKVLQDNDFQFVVWCNFTDEINAIHEVFPDSEIINGEVELQERDVRIKRFKEKKVKYLIISIAINEGFNLQTCTHEVFYSDNYSRTKGVNAEDRIHRIGQDKECHVFKLIARNSLDLRIRNVRERKSKICEVFENS